MVRERSMNSNIVKPDKDIEKLPRKLQQLAQVFTENIYFCDLKSACEFAQLNYNSIRSMISAQKKKGNNFWVLVENMRKEKLLAFKPFIDNRMITGALDGTHKDKELFYKLSGDIQTGVNANVNVNIQNNIRFPVSKSDIVPIDLKSVENE